MTGYFVTRVVLALVLVWLLHREIPSDLRRYAEFMFVYQILPQDLFSQTYWQLVWLPLEIFQSVLSFYVCRTIFNQVTRTKTFWWERVDVILFALCVAGSFIMITWVWMPESAFEMVFVLRQYYRLGLLMIWLSIASWFVFMRPIDMNQESRCLLLFWSIWLTSQFISSTTGVACLSWKIIDRHNGMWWWLTLNESAMVMQIIAVIHCGLKLRRRLTNEFT